eukprot:GAHX01002501.1.p1 GENE.GAHX01002501.1~~GAHX01002501.1.p1  ORF type:complete len:52 (-),score=3.13 GAHX01002501.1:46-201(-)
MPLVSCFKMFSRDHISASILPLQMRQLHDIPYLIKTCWGNIKINTLQTDVQ